MRGGCSNGVERSLGSLAPRETIPSPCLGRGVQDAERLARSPECQCVHRSLLRNERWRLLNRPHPTWVDTEDKRASGPRAAPAPLTPGLQRKPGEISDSGPEPNFAAAPEQRSKAPDVAPRVMQVPSDPAPLLFLRTE